MSFNNSQMSSSSPARTGLSIQELKQLTALRMSQAQPQNDPKSRSILKEAHGHPPRNPQTPPVPPRPVVSYSAPPTEVKSKNRSSDQHSKQSKNKGRGRTSPVDTSFGSMPHGLTVQELKELTRIRLAREAVTTYSPETSEYSDARTHTTSATFRSGYTGDVDSYSDSGSVPRNRSTSTSPISNTDSDSYEEGYARYTAYHPPIPISPSSLSRPERQIPYSPDHAAPYAKSPLTSPNRTPSQPLQFPSNHSVPKSFSGIHPGLQSVSIPQASTPRLVPPQEHIADNPVFIHDLPPNRDDQVKQSSSTYPVHASINSATQNVRSGVPSIERERDSLPSTAGNSLRKFALTNTMNNFETPPEMSSGPLNPLFSFISPSVGELSPPGSPQRSFRGKKKLVIDCPAPVRIRSSSDCNDLAFEMAEAVLNSPAPGSPMNGSKPVWSDPPSRRTSVCSVHSDNGLVSGILHDSNGIGLSIPAMLSGDPDGLDSLWVNDHHATLKNPHLTHSPVTLQTLTTAFHGAPFFGDDQDAIPEWK